MHIRLREDEILCFYRSSDDLEFAALSQCHYPLRIAHKRDGKEWYTEFGEFLDEAPYSDDTKMIVVLIDSERTLFFE